VLNSNNPTITSWVEIPPQSDFPIQNLPFGIFKTTDRSPRAGVAIGHFIIDLHELAQQGYLDKIDSTTTSLFSQPYLNSFFSGGRSAVRKIRERLSEILRHDNPELRDHTANRKKILVPLHDATLCMPIKIGNYTDFYSSIEHASNVGKLFRDPQNPLLPNWKHMPIAYHGRASSIILSGTPIHRPKGQTKTDGQVNPVFGPTKALDFELEMAFVIGKPSTLGHSISVQEAEEHIIGFMLFNDWSARDIQRWEYVPLGPFLGKNFGSSISAWIVTLDALEPYRIEGPQQDIPILPYLQVNGKNNFDIQLEVIIQPKEGKEVSICQTNFKNIYWSIHQQLAHHTINGCNVDTGDVMASGTISGSDEKSYGSMLELTWNGKKPLSMPDGTERKFIQDGDTVIMRGFSTKNGIRIGFGEVRNTILPSL